MSRLFWIVVAVLVAVAAHAATVLFLPRMEMRTRMEDMASAAGGKNRFAMLDARAAGRLAGRPLAHMLYGGCLIEPGDGAVEMNVAISAGYWSLTVYSPSGGIIHTLNDRHADEGRLPVVFTVARQAAPGEGIITAPRMRKGRLFVPLEGARALAVLRAYVPHPGLAQRMRRDFAATTCRLRPSGAAE